MNIQRDTEYRFGELVQSPEYSNEQGVVVTIKSLATGQTMKVYLDEPTQGVEDGINYTNYTGHFYEEEFMATLSEGVEFTGLPLMYSYWDGITNHAVIDVENHSVIIRRNEMTSPVNLLSNPIYIPLIDSQDPNNTSRNAVMYLFTPFGVTPEDPTFGPTIPPGDVVVTPGGEGPGLGPTQN